MQRFLPVLGLGYGIGPVSGMAHRSFVACNNSVPLPAFSHALNDIMDFLFEEEEWDGDIAKGSFWPEDLFHPTSSDAPAPGKRKSTSQGDKETKLVSHRLRGFNRTYCASQRLFDELYGPLIHGMDILTLARICAHYLHLYLDREAFRRLTCRIKWFEEHLDAIEPFLRSHVVMVDDDMEFRARPDLIDQVRTFTQPPAPLRDSTKLVHRRLPRRVTAFWIVGVDGSEPICFVPDGKGGCKDGIKFDVHARRRLTNVPDSSWTNGPINWDMEPSKAAQIAQKAKRRKQRPRIDPNALNDDRPAPSFDK
jgi:hypothetical protein